jgi:hypothetical protein
MAQQHKVRLSDGIELGPVDLDTLRSWFEGGTIKKDSMVQPLGSKKWVRLMDAVTIDRWQMPDRGAPKAKKSGGSAKPGSAPTAAQHERRAGPPPRWRTVLAAALLLFAAAGAGFFAFFPERWLASLRLAPWREIALTFLAMGLALMRGWELARKLVRALTFLLTAALFPLAGILWVEGVRGDGLLVLASALVLGAALFALLSGARLSALAATACVLLVLAGGAGVGYFGSLRQRSLGGTPQPPASEAAATR